MPKTFKIRGEEVTVLLDTYAYGGTLMRLRLEDHEPYATISVNLTHDGSEPPPPDHIWTKNWSENEGLIDELEELGLLTRTGEVKATGFVVSELAKLSDELLENLHAKV